MLLTFWLVLLLEAKVRLKDLLSQPASLGKNQMQELESEQCGRWREDLLEPHRAVNLSLKFSYRQHCIDYCRLSAGTGRAMPAMRWLLLHLSASSQFSRGKMSFRCEKRSASFLWDKVWGN